MPYCILESSEGSYNPEEKFHHKISRTLHNSASGKELKFSGIRFTPKDGKTYSCFWTIPLKQIKYWFSLLQNKPARVNRPDILQERFFLCKHNRNSCTAKPLPRLFRKLWNFQYWK